MLRARVSPTGVKPDLRIVEAVDCVVEQVDEEIERALIGPPRSRAVDRGLLDLDDGATGGDELPKLRIQDRREIPHELALVVVVHVRLDCQYRRGEIGRDGSELDRLLRSGLRDPPDLRELERDPRADLAHDRVVLPAT